MNNVDLEQRITALEQRLHRTRTVFGAFVLAVAAVGVVAATSPVGDLRARSVTIIDAKGTERIILGAPLPSPPGEAGERFMPATGMLVTDENGRERFGLGYYPNGQMTMGFDAAPGQGSGNRERLHLGVEPDGTSFIRYLNQRGGLAGRIVLDDDDRVRMQFWDAQPGSKVFKRGALDVTGWKPLADYPIPPPSR